jgi:hypothetical protein
MTSKSGGDEELDRRKRLHSPETDIESSKVLKTSDTTLDTHVSVMVLENGKPENSSIDPTTPVSHTRRATSPTNLNLISKCKSLFSSSPPKHVINCDFLYQLIIGQEMRIFKLEEDKERQEKEVSELKEEINTLKVKVTQQAESVTGEDKNSETDEEFISHVKRELPRLSDGCAGNEADIRKIQEDIVELKNDATVTTTSRDTLDQNHVMAGVATGGSQGDNRVGGLDISAMDTELIRLGGEAREMKEKATKVHRRAHLEGEKRDQYSRREILRVTGVPYNQGEDTTDLMIRIANSLGVYISRSDISVSHRNGRRVEGTPRPILCKFVRREIKNQILANRYLAGNIRTDDEGKPVRIYIDEALTTMRANICRKLREEKVQHHTRDGKIFIATGASVPGGPDFKVFDTPVDWERMEWSDSIKMELGLYPRD